MTPPHLLFPSVGDGATVNSLRTAMLDGEQRPKGRHRSLQPNTTRNRHVPLVHDDRMDASGLLTAHEVARRLSVSPASVYRLAERRALPFYRIRGVLRFAPRDLDGFLADQRVDGSER